MLAHSQPPSYAEAVGLQNQEQPSLMDFCKAADKAFLNAMWNFADLDRTYFKDDLDKLSLLGNLQLIEHSLNQAVSQRYLHPVQGKVLRQQIMMLLEIANQFAKNNLTACGEMRDNVSITNSNNHVEIHRFTPLFEREFARLNQRVGQYFHEPEVRTLKEGLKKAAYFIFRNLIIGTIAVTLVGAAIVTGGLAFMLSGILPPFNGKDCKILLQKAWGRRSDLKRFAFDELTENVANKTKSSIDPWVGEKSSRGFWGSLFFGAPSCQEVARHQSNHLNKKEACVKKFNPGFSR